MCVLSAVVCMSSYKCDDWRSELIYTGHDNKIMQRTISNQSQIGFAAKSCLNKCGTCIDTKSP